MLTTRKLKKIIQNEVINFLREMNSLDRAINRLKRGGGQDKEEDVTARRIRANNDDEMTARRQKTKQARNNIVYDGYYDDPHDGRIFIFHNLDTKKTEDVSESDLVNHPKLKALIPSDELTNRDDDYNSSWTDEADESFDAYVDGLLDKIGTQGTRGK